MSVRILQGDCRDVLKSLPDASVHCCVTSPPYFGLRDYGMAEQIGLENDPAAFVAELVAVFREVRRVLRNDGTLWLNLGDSYAGSGRGGNTGYGTSTIAGLQPDHSRMAKQGQRPGGVSHAPTARGSRLPAGMHAEQVEQRALGRAWVPPPKGLKNKDLIGIPWRVAFALQADGWFLRQDIIWSKPNPMPESVADRCTKAHEYVFLLSRSPVYYCDMQAIAEPVAASTVDRLAQDIESQAGSDRVPGKTNGAMKARGSKRNSFARETKYSDGGSGQTGQHRADREDIDYTGTRNKRSVWTITTKSFKEAHFATMAPELAENCIKAGCPQGGVVLDPFGGAGTTGLVADRLHRGALLIELNPAYVGIAKRRIASDAPLFADVTA